VDERAKLIALAEEHLAAARDSLRASRHNAAFESARHAAEVAGKAMLLDATGEFPKRHDIGGLLHQQGLVPADLDPVALDRLLAAHTRGRYEWSEAGASDAREAIRQAEAMVRAARERMR
jgi:HEPN domain-containing protein